MIIDRLIDTHVLCVFVFFQVGCSFVLVVKCNDLDAPKSSLDAAKLVIKASLPRAVLSNRMWKDGNVLYLHRPNGSSV